MNYADIPANTWRLIEIIVMRYPEQELEYERRITKMLESYSGQNELSIVSKKINKPTENTAIMLESPYMIRLQNEVSVVKSVFDKLAFEHQKVIGGRFWHSSEQGIYKKVPYSRIYTRNNYSAVTMQRVVKKFIYDVARELGQIE